MAIDTQEDRLAMLAFGNGEDALPKPEDTLTRAGRYQLLGLYREGLTMAVELRIQVHID